jgi:RNA polymerase sigma-70 factor (ECF subfamily)
MALNAQAEVELAKRLMTGDEAAFEPFAQHFRAKIAHYSWMMCGQREDAEEVAQDTMVKILENASQLRDAQNVRSWVFRIAKNACLMKRRKSMFAPEHELSLDEPIADRDGQHRDVADTNILQDAQVIREEQKQALEGAIRTLPQLYRAVILLRDFEELSTQETAQILDVSEDVVKTRLLRARRAVREKLLENAAA